MAKPSNYRVSFDEESDQHCLPFSGTSRSDVIDAQGKPQTIYERRFAHAQIEPTRYYYYLSKRSVTSYAWPKETPVDYTWQSNATAVFQWLMPNINAFRSSWPEVEVDLASGFSFDPLPALVRGDLDLVVTFDPLEIAGITYVPLFKYEALLAVDSHHLFAEKSFIHAKDLGSLTLITYPIARDRQDIFTRFLDPADIEPAQIRASEFTVMMMQLVASGRGVCCRPNWAIHEYSARSYVTARRLGDKGLFATLYAAVRSDILETPYMSDFLLAAKATSFTTLEGVSSVIE